MEQIKPDETFVWVRFRTVHAAGPGRWEWREFSFPTDSLKSTKSRNKFFKDEHLDYLDSEFSTQSEYWRGIEYDFPPVPRHIVEAKIKGLQWQAMALGGHIHRLTYALSLGLYPVVENSPRTTCVQWPRCGCLKQGKRKDCRKPREPWVIDDNQS